MSMVVLTAPMRSCGRVLGETVFSGKGYGHTCWIRVQVRYRTSSPFCIDEQLLNMPLFDFLTLLTFYGGDR